MNSVSELEQWIFSFYGKEQYTPGLERISTALKSLKPKLASSRIITIAGTNGKGETTHRLGRFLNDSTFCSWTSPHINSVTERFSSETGDIDFETLNKIVLNCHEETQKQKFQLSYYEFLFFVFCSWATSKNPKYLLLEVGLGGRLDAVNALDAEVALLSSISRDHQEYLGPRYDLILNEKLGVVRKQATLISFLDLDYLRERVQKFSQENEVNLIDLEHWVDLAPFKFSQRNQFLAYAAFCHLTNRPLIAENCPLSPEKLAFRGEILKGENEWWLFGSHNVDGVRKLIQFLNDGNYNFQDSPFNAVVTSFSQRNEKDLIIMLKMLKRSGLGKVLVTSFNHPKAYPKAQLKKLCDHEGLTFVENISELVQGWTHQKILVAGSYYFLGQLKPLLGHNR